MRQYFKLIFVGLCLLFSNSISGNTPSSTDPGKRKKEITIVITDSGLGGLDVMGDIAKKLSGSGHYKKVNLIFVNALFEAGKGYNALNSREEKIRTFNNVLMGIEENYHPDIIMVACNTLSVLVKETAFVKNSDTKVVGIVEAGVSMIEWSMENEPNSSVIITGTETTITEDSHRKALIKNGVSENSIITQSCPQLQSYIEQDPEGEDTGMLISIYIDEAVSRLPEDHGPVFLSLNCSHFGYSDEFWREAFEYVNCDLAGILNPNETMGDFLFPTETAGRYKSTTVDLSVVSKVKILNKEAMVNFLQGSSPNMAEALKNYHIAPELF
jgi:glutamate racemase